MKAFLQTRVSPVGLLHAAGVLAALATVTGFLGRWWWLCELTTHFRLQYALALLVVAVMSLVLPRTTPAQPSPWLKRRWPAFVYAALALTNLAVLAPYLLTSPRSDPDPNPSPSPNLAAAPRFRVVALNVHTANARHDLVEAFLRREAPDVVVLTEVDERWLKQLLPLTNTWPHTVAAPRDDNFGIALYSRWPLSSSQTVFLGEADLPSLEADVRIKDRTVRVLGTHPLPPSNAENAALRDAQLAAVAAHLAAIPGPRVLLGDLNATPWSPCFQHLVQSSGLRDTLRGRGYQPTWPAASFFFWIPLDHCLISPDLTVCDRRIGPRIGSDHLPLIVDLTWPK